MSDVKTESLWLMHGNCLDRMKEIPDVPSRDMLWLFDNGHLS